MASKYSDWDTIDDWTNWTITGSGDLATSRETAPPIEYRGGVGRIRLTGAADTNYTWSAKESVASGRFARWSGAIWMNSLALASSLIGPLSVTTLDELGAGATPMLTKTFTTALKIGKSTQGTGSIPVSRFPNSWVVFEFVGESRDRPGAANVQPFEVSARMNFWLARGTRLWPLGGLVWDPTTLTDVHRFSQFFLGFASMDQTTDDFDFYIDEWKTETGSSQPASRMPRSRRHPWPTTL